MRTTSRARMEGSFGIARSGNGDVERLDQDVFDGERFAMGSQAFEVNFDGFTDVVGSLLQRVTLGMTARQGRTECVIAAAGLCLEDDRVPHARSIAENATATTRYAFTGVITFVQLSANRYAACVSSGLMPAPVISIGTNGQF
jgi:hypothetical protein